MCNKTHLDSNVDEIDKHLSNTWNSIYSESEWGKYPNEELIRFIASNFYARENRSDVRILEVGSGTGTNLWYLSREGFTCFGIDGSEVGVKRSLDRLREEVPSWNGDVLKANFKKLNFEDDFFDAVIDNASIYCNSFDDSKQTYDEIYRVLKNRGVVYTRVFSTKTSGYKTGQYIDYNRYVPNEGPLINRGPVRFSTVDDMRQLLNGFINFKVYSVTRTYDSLNIIDEMIITGLKFKEN